MKNVFTKIKNSVDVSKYRLDKAKERIGELKYQVSA